jgi:hypothetical protein
MLNNYRQGTKKISDEERAELEAMVPDIFVVKKRKSTASGGTGSANKKARIT